MVSDINQFVNKIDNSSDLTESIIEYQSEDLNSDLIRGMTYYELKDSDNKIYRIIAELISQDGTPYSYTFYYKNDDIVFSRIIELKKSGIDTIIDSNYYFSDLELIKQVDIKDEKMESETVKLLSEFYLVFGDDRID
ncbi:hypothetical protein MG296_14355 [Flavobacteriaceae bacterium TK19130]|nr:hypothetical protein [Thermobacterium salinum]